MVRFAKSAMTLLCWFMQVKGWPYWPALVMTQLDADDMKVPGV